MNKLLNAIQSKIAFKSVWNIRYAIILIIVRKILEAIDLLLYRDLLMSARETVEIGLCKTSRL